MLLQPLRHTRLLFGIQPHPFFGTAPDGVVQAANPLVLDQVTQLGFVQLVTEMLAQIRNVLRITEEQLGIAAVGAGVVARHAFGNEREAATQLRGVIVAVIADIAARQHGAFRPRRADAFVIRCQFLQRVRGIGTVINRDVVNLARRMDQKFEFTQMIRARGMQPNSDDLRVSRHTADADAAQALNISLDTPVYYICRRVLADNTPVLFSTDIVPCSLFGTTRTDGIDFTRPIFNILDEACGIQVSSTITHLRAAMGDPAVRHALALQRDQALLELSETCYSRLCRPVLRCRTFYTDFFDFALVRKLV